ncbi:Glucanosyltransferase-domain-containing protein [Microdochium bolleyi]|uniref:1,3-beta-glucanosyltransferase n=1 Tax=Microdochium bolleyi TaxID=196109 RepID=A0A136JGY9_9PEZI|nr:Glucanosyltransferase-domain-containing protein [Microdochium bolleyi]
MEPVTILGRYFYKGDRRFLLNGVVYQLHQASSAAPAGEPRSTRDALADENLDTLERCMPLFRELELNVLFVFWIDPRKNHDAAMALLAEAGIYVLVSVADPHHAVNRATPLASYSDPVNLQHWFRVVDVMARYTNTLGLLVGNEVINAVASTGLAPPVLRAVTRDLKRYMRLCAEVDAGVGEDGDGAGNGVEGEQPSSSPRTPMVSGSQTSTGNSAVITSQQRQEYKRRGRRVLPLGYSAADVLSVRQQTFDYFVAGPEVEALDFFAFNNYSWVGRASIQIAGWDHTIRSFSHSPVPVFFSEYGAQIGQPRIFEETRALYSPAMTGVFSGGIVYEWFYGSNRYGLVNLARRIPAVRERPKQRREQPLAGGFQDGEKWTKGRLRKREVRREEQFTLRQVESHAAAEAVTANTSRSPTRDEEDGDPPESDNDGGEDSEYEGPLPPAGEPVEVLQKRIDFENLRRSLMTCRDKRHPSSTAAAEVVEVADRPPFPPTGPNWHATPDGVPPSPLDWDEVRAQLLADREWVDIGAEIGVDSDGSGEE